MLFVDSLSHFKGLIKKGQVKLISHKQNCTEQHNALSSLRLTRATVSSSELMRGNAKRGEAEPLSPKPPSYNDLLKKGELCSVQHKQVPL